MDEQDMYLQLQVLMASPKGFLPKAELSCRQLPFPPRKVTIASIGEAANFYRRWSFLHTPLQPCSWLGACSSSGPKKACPQCYDPTAPSSVIPCLSPLPSWRGAGWGKERDPGCSPVSTSGERIISVWHGWEARGAAVKAHQAAQQQLDGAPACRQTSAQPTAFGFPAWDQLESKGDF